MVSEKPESVEDKKIELTDVQIQLLREGQPMMITDAFVEKPCMIIGGGILILIILTIIAVACKFFEMDTPSDREFLVWSDPRTISWDKQLAAQEAIRLNDNSQKAIRVQQEPDWNAIMIYQGPTKTENLI